ncbi:hypothetical protein JCM3765_000111 [Sporobolomyces pararoseus]
MSASTVEATPSSVEEGQSTSVDTTAEPTTTENSSSSAGSPPVRPPKAAKRPSTASLSNQPPVEAGAIQGVPVALGAPATGQTGTEGGEEVADLSTNNTTTNTTGDEVPKELNTGTTVSTTAESSETASSSKPVQSSAAVSKEQTQKPSTSTPSASASSAPNTTSRAVPSSSTSKPTTSTPKKKRKGGPFSFLFACVPCISDPGHDDDYSKPQQQKKPVTSSSTNSPTTAKENEKVAQPEQQTSKTSTIDEKSPIVPSSTTAPSAPVEPETAITPTSTEPLAASTPSTLTPPPPSSSPTPQGVTLPREETEGVTSGAVVPPGQATLLASPPTAPAVAPKSRRRKSGKHPQSSGTDGIITSVPEPGARQGGIILAGGGDGTETSEDGSEDDEDEDEYPEEEEEEEDEEQSLIARGGVGIPIGEDGLPHPLLDELSPDLKGRKCLVLDLDETLVHSSFKMVHQADYVVPVEIENQFHNVYVIKRPGVDGFLKAMGEIYEVVVFTASLSKYADPVLDQLDIHRVVKHRLFRESCYNNKGNYVKDLSQLGRPIDECIIIDNSPASYVFHVNNAVPISSWFNDPHDTELTDLVPFLTDLSTVDDVRSVLDAGLYQHLAPTRENGSDPVFNQI